MLYTKKVKVLVKLFFFVRENIAWATAGGFHHLKP